MKLVGFFLWAEITRAIVVPWILELLKIFKTFETKGFINFEIVKCP